jgi:hypothetical protein
MSRPTFAPFHWASLPQFADPGEVWDGQESVVRPSAGYIAQGFLPNAPWPAEYVNWAIQDLGLRAQHLDLIDVQNWIETSNIGAAAGTVNGIAAFPDSTPNRRILLAMDDGDLLGSDDGGYTWSVEISLAGGYVCKDVATRQRTDTDATDSAVAMINDNGTVADVRISGPGAGWSSNALVGTGVEIVSRIQPDRYRGGFWITGQIAANDPAVYRLPDTQGTPGTISYLTLVGTTGIAGPLVVGRDFVLAADAWQAGSGGLALYGFDPVNDTSLTAMTSPDPFRRITDLMYDEEHNYFVAVFAYAGSPPGGIKIWRSATGANGSWTDVTPAWMETLYRPLTTSGRPDNGCARGSVLTFLVQRISDSKHFIVISADGGLTWKLLPDPLARLWPTVTPDPKSIMIRIADRRAIVCSYAASGDAYLVQSLRTGQ